MCVSNSPNCCDDNVPSRRNTRLFRKLGEVFPGNEKLVVHAAICRQLGYFAPPIERNPFRLPLGF